MKKFLLAITLPTIIGLAVFFWPRPVEAVTPEKEPYHESVVCEMFDLVAQSETLRAELYEANPNIAKAALQESPDCIVRKAAALLVLRGIDESWADTIGECVDDDDLDICIAQVLYDAEHEVH